MGTGYTAQANREVHLGTMQVDFAIDGRTVSASAEVIHNLVPSPALQFAVAGIERHLSAAGSLPSGAEGYAGLGWKSFALFSDGPSSVKLETGLQLDIVPHRWGARQTEGVLRPAQMPCVVLDTGEPMRTIRFAVLNLNWSGRHQRIVLEARPWRVVVDPVSNFSDLESVLEEQGGYAITHGGTVERSDGSLFPLCEAEQLLHGLEHFFDFLCGSCCALSDVVATDDNGKAVWKRWGNGYVSPWHSVRSWSDITINSRISGIFEGFWWQFKINRRDLLRVLGWYVHSNETSAVDVGIVLNQSAIELLAYTRIGPKPGHQRTGEWIKSALTAVGMPTGIPPGCQELIACSLREGFAHGPHTTVEIRNSLVHAEERVAEISLDEYHEAKQLGLWYIELMLLWMFEYHGRYANRLVVQTMGNTEPVPWAPP